MFVGHEKAGGQLPRGPANQGLANAGGQPALQAGGHGFESRRLHKPLNTKGSSDFRAGRPRKSRCSPSEQLPSSESAPFSSAAGSPTARLAPLDGYETALQRFARTSGIADLEEPTPQAIQSHLAGLWETLKPASVHHYFRPIRTFFQCCV